MERAELMTYTAASHQMAIKIFYLHFSGCVKITWAASENRRLPYYIIKIIICYIYIALFWVLKALYMKGGGGGLLIHHQCAASTWMMRRQPYCARTLTTYQLIGGEETVMKPISRWGWLGGHDGQRPMGKFGQDARVTPLLFFEGHLGIFNDLRESGPLFNVSSEGWCLLTV